MNMRRLWLCVALLLCAVTVIVAAPSSTVAYIADRSNTVRNTFRVEYLPAQDVTVPVRVHKTVHCLGMEEIGPEGFSFRLVQADSGRTIALTSGADGWTTANLVFTADDAGKTYRYRLYEANGGRENVTYDERVYEFSIALQLNDQRELSVLLTMDGKPVTELTAEFVNLYDAMEIPDTGDAAQPLLWLMMLLISGAGLVLLCNKKAIGRRV